MTATYPAGTPTGVRVCDLETLLLTSFPNVLGGFSYQSLGYFTEAAVNARTGALLWGPFNKTVPQYHDITMYAAREGAFVLIDKDTQDIYCYSLEDGSLMWGPVSLVPYTNPWSYIELDGEVYNGVVVFWDFGGNVIGLDKESGDILWHWNRGSSGYATPHGIYPLWDFGSESFADGKAFFSEGSMYDVPLHPACRIAINVTDGTLVWKILSFSGRAPGAISDGYLIECNAISNEMICIGKGPSATTVKIENDVTTFGHKVLVTGMVTDVSPGTAAYNREARFPNGVPAISDEDQEAWMEYVYMQQAKPANAKGVEVVISVLDSNGNTYDVGTVTSDVNGKFQLAFDPEITGEYTVYAKFAGSESYWGSSAETALFVEEAPVASPTPQPITLPPTETYVAVGTGLIILAIAIVGILLIRKH
jgi:outer membrane protein assembly factor BamB